MKPITNIEKVCLIYAARGYTSKEAAKDLGLSYYTVRDHWQSASNKLGAQTMAGTVAQAFIRGVIEPGDVSRSAA